MRNPLKTKLRLATAAFATLTTVGLWASEPTVTDVIAKQRYPWNGLVDITCKVTGIVGTTNGLDFAVSALMPDSGDVRKVTNFWVVRNGINSTDREVHTNGNYRLLWDASADLGQVSYDNMVLRVTTDKGHIKVQLWEGGPYWADTNIGAENPEDYGYYFWWGDTVGYKRENDKWVAADGSSSNYSFDSSNTPPIDMVTTLKDMVTTLKNQGWITADEVLAPEHDAAHVHWGAGWRMPTEQELSDLVSKCDWTWTAMNGVNGYIVKGTGTCASASIFLPAAGVGGDTSLYHSSEGDYYGAYWSSVPDLNDWVYQICPRLLLFYQSRHSVDSFFDRNDGLPVRPVQGFSE